MVKKLFTNILIFLVVFVLISIIADIYYYNRVIQKDSSGKNQICYSDFRVLWTAAYNIHHHVLRDNSSNPVAFRLFWFLDPRFRNSVRPIALEGEPPDTYKIYNTSVNFYHYRYSPFIAFIMMPFGKLHNQGRTLAIWYMVLNIAFLSSLLFINIEINKTFGLLNKYRYTILWGVLLGSLRFYFMNISLGQTDILIAFLFTLFLMAYIRNKEILCGIMLGLILQFKLFFLPTLLYFIFIKKWKIILSTIVSFISFLFIPAYMIGLDKNMALLKDWFSILGLSISSQILNVKNQSIVYAVSNLLLKIAAAKNIFAAPEYLFYLISAAFIFPIYIFMVRFKKNVPIENEKKYNYLGVSLLIIVSLLFSPIAWESHFITLIIPLGAAIYFTINSCKRKIMYAGLGAFFILSCVVGTDLTKFIPIINKASANNIAFGTIILALTIIYGHKQNAQRIRI